MKYVKMLGLLAVAAAALMAFAGSASASTITSPTGTPAEALTATAGATSLDGAFVTVTCQSSHVAGTVTSQGSGVTVNGTITALSFANCNYPVHVQETGSLELHSVKKGSSPHSTCETGVYCNGTLTSSGAKVEITTSVGPCVFTTAGTNVGTVTGTDTTGGNAKLDIQGTIPRTGGTFLCGSTGTWTGSYNVTAPSTLWIDE
jgi:hypothetical protein